MFEIGKWGIENKLRIIRILGKAAASTKLS